MVRRSGFHGIAVVLLLVVCATTGAGADEPRKFHRVEVGVQGGFYLPDRDQTNKDSGLQELEPIAGLRFGLLFAKRLEWFVDATVTDDNSDVVVDPPNTIGDVETRVYRSGLNLFFKPHEKKVSWFVGVGGGIADVGIETLEDFERNFASVSVGQRVRLDGRASFRWEVRGDQYFDDNDAFEGTDITRTMFLISVNWGLGRSRNDSDGDGVLDRNDDCPDTPSCAVVDEHGCPIDSDGDGVPDGCDKCPNTPSCAVVDKDGCPIDSDGDGVPDGCDKCPGTPPGTQVRPDGCPRAKPLFTEQTKTLILEGVFFEFDKAILKPISRTTLDRVAESMRDWPDVRVEVAGHTDWVGPDAYNQDLSERRARSVMEYLISKGIGADRLRARGYGEGEPIADNESEAGRSKNRRVELKKLN